MFENCLSGFFSESMTHHMLNCEAHSLMLIYLWISLEIQTLFSTEGRRIRLYSAHNQSPNIMNNQLPPSLNHSPEQIVTGLERSS